MTRLPDCNSPQKANTEEAEDNVKSVAMLQALKFVGFVVVNLAIAIFATAILDHGIWRAIPSPSHDIVRVIWKESIISIICAAGLGFSVWRIWRTSAAKYTWIPAAAWLGIGFLAIGDRTNVMGRLLPFGSQANFYATDFLAFTVPLIRAVSYSSGWYLSSLLSPAASRS